MPSSVALPDRVAAVLFRLGVTEGIKGVLPGETS